MVAGVIEITVLYLFSSHQRQFGVKSRMEQQGVKILLGLMSADGVGSFEVLKF